MGGVGISIRMRFVLMWSLIGVLLLLAFAAALGAVQRTFYSASGFVTAYVQTIAAHDVRSALSMPGAAPSAANLSRAGLPVNASRELLRADILPRITDVEVVSDSTARSGEHTVTVRVQADGRPVETSFTVRSSGSVLGVLPTWTFTTTPLAVVHVTVAHADTFTVGGHTLNPRAADPSQPADSFSVSADYLVFAPARYELTHASKYLEAAPSAVTGNPARVLEATVDAQPTSAFTSATQEQLNAFLDQCAQQQVLQPAGCPFGVEIADRVQGTPTWSMLSYPAVRLQAGATAWTMEQTAGVVHLSVTVQSLFDGTVEQRESDERFAVSLSSVVIRPDGSLDIVVGE